MSDSFLQEVKWQDILPGLGGYLIHVLNTEREDLIKVLVTHEFRVFVLEGARITDEDTFYDEAQAVFGLPDYFGRNYNAWNDSFNNDFLDANPGRIAIIWNDADASLTANAQCTISWICELYESARFSMYRPAPDSPGNVTQRVRMEIFLLGHGPGFQALNTARGR